MVESLERSRAGKAVERINHHLGTHERRKDLFWQDYGNAVAGLPLAIRQQGLARALAEVRAGARKDGRFAVLGDLCEGILIWFEEARKPPAFTDLEARLKSDTQKAAKETADKLEALEKNTELAIEKKKVEREAVERSASLVAAEAAAMALIEESIKLEFQDYIVLQRECLEILSWLKTLAEPHRPPRPQKSTASESPEKTEYTTLAVDAAAKEARS
jgi:hypothetical protein